MLCIFIHISYFDDNTMLSHAQHVDEKIVCPLKCDMLKWKRTIWHVSVRWLSLTDKRYFHDKETSFPD